MSFFAGRSDLHAGGRHQQTRPHTDLQNIGSLRVQALWVGTVWETEPYPSTGRPAQRNFLPDLSQLCPASFFHFQFQTEPAVSRFVDLTPGSDMLEAMAQRKRRRIAFEIQSPGRPTPRAKKLSGKRRREIASRGGKFGRSARHLSTPFWRRFTDEGTRSLKGRDGFTPLFDHLEGTNTAQVDTVASDVLQRFGDASVPNLPISSECWRAKTGRMMRPQIAYRITDP